MENSLIKVDKAKFAEGYYNFYKLVLMFVLGSFIGDIYEVLLHFLKHHELVARRGVVFGPFNPIYGFALVLMIVFLGKEKNPFKMFLIGTIIGGTFEYLCSFIQEKVFGSYAWDYSNLVLNINGRTTLPIAMFWGLFFLISMKTYVPFISESIEKMPIKVGKAVAVFFAVFMAFDLGISAVSAGRFYERKMHIEAKNVVDEFLDKTFPDEFMEKVYSNSEFVVDGNKELNTLASKKSLF